MEIKNFHTKKEATDLKREIIRMIQKASNDKEKLDSFVNFFLKFHNYSFFNKSLILFQYPTATQVAGKKKWEEEFKRIVRQNEHGIAILAPVMKTMFDKDKKDKEGKPLKYQILTGFKTVRVYDLAQTDGPDIEVPAEVGIKTDNPDELYQELAFMLSLDKYNIEESDLPFEETHEIHESIIKVNKRIPIDAKVMSLIEAISQEKLGHFGKRRELDFQTKKNEIRVTTSIVGCLFGVPVNTWVDVDQMEDKSIDACIKAVDTVVNLVGEKNPINSIKEGA